MTDYTTASSDWPIVQFGDVVRQTKENADPETSDLERYVAGSHMQTDDLHIREWGTIGNGYLGPAFHRLFRRGQTLYGSRRTYLRKVAYAEWDGICANTTFVLEPKDPTVLLPELLPFIMQTESFVEHAIMNSRGSVNPYVNFRDLAWYEFALPPLDKQRHIAEILWAADEAVELLQHAKIQHKFAAHRVFSELIRQATCENLRLDDCTLLITDGDHNPPKRQPEGIPHIVVQNIDNGTINVEDCTYISPEDYVIVRKRYDPQPNDIIVTCVGTIGRIAIVPKKFAFSADRSLAIIRFDSQKVLVPFGVDLLMSASIQQKMEVRSIGTAQQHLYLKDIRSLQVDIPTIERQRHIIHLMSSFRASAAKLEKMVEQTSITKSQLLNTLIG